jgi:hypothetical protein
MRDARLYFAQFILPVARLISVGSRQLPMAAD